MVLTARKASSGAYIPRIKKPAVSGGTKEGGSGLRVRRLKHKAVIVCEVPHICPLVEWISCVTRTAETRIRTLEQAMLALVIEYSKLLLLFLLIGSVVTVSRFESRKQSSPLP
jgi:hypothetical protein